VRRICKSVKFKGTPVRVFYMVWDSPASLSIGGPPLDLRKRSRIAVPAIFSTISRLSVADRRITNVVSRNPELILMWTTPITAQDWRDRWTPCTTIHAVQTKQVITFEHATRSHGADRLSTRYRVRG
jgi:hypothetical protein